MAETILVCVTGQLSGARLIQRGTQLAKEHAGTLLVLSVSGSGANLLSNPDVSNALNELYRLSGEAGAEMTMLHDRDALHAITTFARERGVTRMVLGEGQPGSSFVSRLTRALPQVRFTVEPCENFLSIQETK